MSDKDKIFIFDTTMRDGEQSPGASMSIEEKIQIARIFDELGIDVIEAGFPIASPGMQLENQLQLHLCLIHQKFLQFEFFLQYSLMHQVTAHHLAS